MDLNHLKFFYKKNLFTQIILLFISVLIKMVPEAGFEPARLEGQGIFVLLYVTIATFLCCSLDSVFTMSIIIDLGGWCIVSTHNH